MNDLPDDLTQRGYKLIVRAPNRMFAVSYARGCTGTKATLREVINEARRLTLYLEQREDHAHASDRE